MRVPLSWLADYVDLPGSVTPAEVGAALVRAGLEVERVEIVGADVTGVVVGQVLAFDAEPQSNGKTVRWCQVDVGEQEPRGIVCGAANFAVGDLVAVALPGSVLPGPFPIMARKTYGHVSDGMICSARELGLGDEHSGILVLPPDSLIGADVVEAFGLRDAVLDIAVTPDRSYCLSVRGVAREAATAFGLPFNDKALRALLPAPPADDQGFPVVVLDAVGCDRYTARTISGIDPAAVSPMWLQRRLIMAGMRPVSLVVDVTNHVMLDLGQPLHAFDRDQLAGSIIVRAAEPGERLTTLDGVDRVLDDGELLICDEKGPVALAGVMGGRRTECTATTTSIVLESAHFAAVPTARTARRHKLPSEASKRYERGVDHALAPSAGAAAVDLLVRLAGATADPGLTDVDNRVLTGATITLDPALPGRVAGRDYTEQVVRARLVDIGCTVEGLAGGGLSVTAPSWRPDLTVAIELVEEVVRLEGYDEVPSLLPRSVAGRGLTRSQRVRRNLGRALASAGYVETLSYPFMGPAVLDALGLPADDRRRNASALLNPISEDEPLLRTTLLPGLLATLLRNVGRGAKDVAVSETGLVFGPSATSFDGMHWGGGGRPPDEVLAYLNGRIPEQRLHLAVAIAPTAGTSDAAWWGAGRPPAWAEAIEAARLVASTAGVTLQVTKDQQAPFHPGRCARLSVGGAVVGHAGELHPRAVAALGLPARTAVVELDLTPVLAVDSATIPSPSISSFPDAGRDVAVVVATAVPAADVQAALSAGAGPLLESIALFDVYSGGQVPARHRSLAFALRFRAGDRTLTDDEVNAARDAALAVAAERTGATLR